MKCFEGHDDGYALLKCGGNTDVIMVKYEYKDKNTTCITII